MFIGMHMYLVAINIIIKQAMTQDSFVYMYYNDDNSYI